MDWIYAKEKPNTSIIEKNGVTFLTSAGLSAAGVRHGISTRLGGVSSGHLASMNLSFTRGDDPDNVVENFSRIGRAIGFDYHNVVMSAQIHETRIRIVGKENRGEGILRETVPGVDGLVTDQPGVVLYTSYADCVPLMFYDPVRKVIAEAHSGWRGTTKRIGAKMVHVLEERYHSDPADLIVAIGPSICRDCYEVDTPVIREFEKTFRPQQVLTIAPAKGDGKYQLDLWKANQIILEEAGVLPEHIDTPDFCTCCNSGLLFSHRASQGKRGNLGAFMVLDE